MHILPGGIGIAFSDTELQIAHIGFDAKPEGLYRFELPKGLIDDDAVENIEKLQTLCTKISKKHEFDHLNEDKVTLALPESRIFSTHGWIDAELKREERGIEATEMAQAQIPIPFSHAHVRVQLGDVVNEKREAAVFVIEDKVLKPYLNAFQSHLANIGIIEANNAAIFQLIQSRGERIPNDQSIAIIDITNRWANLSVHRHDGMRTFSRSVAFLKEQKKAQRLTVLADAVTEMLHYLEEQNYTLHYIAFAGEADNTTLEGIETSHTKALVSDLVTVPHTRPEDIQIFASAIGAAIRSIHGFKSRHVHNFAEVKQKK